MKKYFRFRFGWLLITMLLGVLDFSAIEAQDVYQLSATGIAQTSMAVRQQDGLLIRDSTGQETFYRREARLDSKDSQWLGYYSKDARQAIQWPQSNQGPMRIGNLEQGQQWQFRSSRMTIQPTQAGSGVGRARLGALR